MNIPNFASDLKIHQKTRNIVRLFYNIREKTGIFRLNKKFQNLIREKALTDFSSAKNVNLIFKATDEKDFTEIKDFMSFLQGKGINTKSFCYVEDKNVPEYLLFRKDLNFFTPKDLNFFFIPKADFIEQFIQERPDMLINLCLTPCFPLKYIINLSQTRLKIGNCSLDESDLDIMIDTHKNNSLGFMIEQVKYYLKILNNKN